MSGQLAARATLRALIESFTFHGDSSPALQNVELVAVPGLLTAVLGGSGSGKSALGRLLAAWLAGGRDGRLVGALHVDVHGSSYGVPLTFAGEDGDPRIDPAAWAEHVGYVPQDPTTMLSGVRSTVAEELAFGLENLGVARAEMMQVVADTAVRTGLTALLERDPATLSGGELRRLAVGCAVVTNPAVLVLDEPLASLDSAGAQTITQLVADLLARGTAVVVLSQQADALTHLAAQWLILREGTLTAAGPPDRLLAGGSLAGSGIVLPGPPGPIPVRTPPRAVAVSTDAPADAPAPAAPALEVEGVSFGFDAGDRGGRLLLENVDLRVSPGEILAVTGPNGAGKSTLLRLCNGLLRPVRGEVRVAGESIAGVPTGIVAARLGLLFQHPHHQLFERTVQREVLFGLDRLYGKQAQAQAGEALAAVGLEHSPDAHPHELSGSGQRLLALATVLAREPAVMALDEPTVALDAHGLDRLAAAMERATDRGAAVVMVTHDLAFARAHAHRTAELRNGRLLGG